MKYKIFIGSLLLALPIFYFLNGFAADRPVRIFFVASFISLAIIIACIYVVKPELLKKENSK